MAPVTTDQPDDRSPDDGELGEFYNTGDPSSTHLADSSADVGRRIAEAREVAGMTRRELSEHLGVRAATVARWETGRSHPRPNRMATIAGLLGVSLSWLLMGHGQTAPEVDDVEALRAELLAVKETLRAVTGEIDRIALQLDGLGREPAG
jgi:HTH-type transcriptional regulator, cell division transcriptional repressor